MTDAQLLERAQQGDRQAWHSLYERLFPSVWRAAMLRLGSHELAEDVVSETFLTLIRRLPMLETDTCRIYGLIHKIMHDKATDHLRKQARRPRTVSLVTDPHLSNGDPVAKVLAEERRETILRVLRSLSDDYQMVLEQKYGEMLSVAGIAERMGLTHKAVESLLYRARNEFREKYRLVDAQSEVPDLSKRQADE